MKKLIIISSCFISFLHGIETKQECGIKKALREKVIACVEQKKQVASDFQIYQLLSVATENNPELYLPRELIQRIIFEAESNSLQTIFDDCEIRDDRSDYLDNPYGYLVEHLQKKTCFELEELFDSLAGQESTLKMALRMVYGKKDLPLRKIMVKCHKLSEPVEKADKRGYDLDDITCYFFFNGGGIRRDQRIEIYNQHWFGGKIKNNLKDFLALLQPLLCWKVRALIIQKNEISTIPETLGWFKDLRTIDFSNNNLTYVPEFLGRLKELCFIRLSDNHLTKVPEVIRHFKGLEDLDLDGNKILALPEWLVEYWSKRLTIAIDKDVVVPWDTKNYPKIWIRRRICEVHKNGDFEYSTIHYAYDA
jgi:hypothetical protein